MKTYRSKFETRVAQSLKARGIKFEYEAHSFLLNIPCSHKYKCQACGDTRIIQFTHYTPDFFIGELVVETKGKFTARDRKIARAFRAQVPHRSYRLVFQRDNKLSKSSKTRYSDWCRDHDITYSIGDIPDGWCKPRRKR